MSTANPVPSSAGTPKVSVAMITYNHERYIAQAVESVLKQKTRFEVEILVGEDCSTDGTRKVLQQLDAAHPGRLRLMLHEKNLGLLGKANLAAVFAACRGEYMILLEGDDFWIDENKLQKQVDFLDAHPEFGGCFHPLYVATPAGEISPFGAGFPPGVDSGGIVEMVKHGFPHLMTLLFRRTLLPPLPPWFYELAMGDWSLCLLLARSKPIAFLRDQRMSAYRLHPTSFWLTQSLLNRTLQERAAMETFARNFDGPGRPLFQQQINCRDFWLSEAYGQMGDFKSARKSFWRAVAGWPRDHGVSAAWVVRYFLRSHLPRFIAWSRRLRGKPVT